MRIFTAIIICAMVSIAADAAPRRQSTARGRLKTTAAATAAPSASGQPIAADTIAPSATDITIAGYDKPVNASKETFFVVNNTDSTITGLTVTLRYTDMQGRQLHQATHEIGCSIPPRQTRMTAVPSWDRQRSFHYHLGARPRKRSTPYDVRCSIDRAIMTR